LISQFYQKKPEDSTFENGDEWRLFVSLKICCGKNLRTDFAMSKIDGF